MFSSFTTAYDKLQKNRIHVVVGQYDSAIVTATEKLNIPYLSTTRMKKKNGSAVFQIHPPLEDFSNAINDLARAYKWETCSYFYDDDQGKFVVLICPFQHF